MRISRFITFEGGEGSGKSTQVKNLVNSLTAKGIKVLRTREPGGSIEAEKIRNLLLSGDINQWQPKAELLLHCAARIQHVQEFLIPELRSGNWVICDRFLDSTIAYQGYGHQLKIEALKQIQSFVLGTFVPDMTILLDLPVDLGLARAKARSKASSHNEDRYERMDLDFHHRVRRGFLKLSKEESKRFVVIDASKSIEEIAEIILNEVEQKFQIEDRS